jgi:CMP-N,N'-diacetyllegionaminic acid synthase
MIEGKTVLAIIPARGGSKGVPRKNIRDLCGKPLIAWTVEEAKKSKYIDRLILSSEDDEIIAAAKKWGCEVPFVRPQEFAQDDTPGIEPVIHAIDALSNKYDYIILLQVTSPLRQVEDIDGCIEFCIQSNAKSCVSMTEAEQSPYWMYHINENNSISSVMLDDKVYKRRQDLPKVYVLNGAIYIAECKWLKGNRDFCSNQTIGYVMSEERSTDIDNEIDLEFTTFLLNKKLSN